jgi:hypothetical protein
VTAPWTEEPNLPAGGYPGAGQLEAIKDQVRYLSEPPACYVRRAATQSIANATFDNIDFDTEDLDPFGMFAPTSDTITFQRAGLYEVNLYVSWAANGTGTRTVIMRVNGATDFGSGTAAGDATVSALNAWSYYSAAVDDSMVFIVRQTSGGALNIASSRLLVRMARG